MTGLDAEDFYREFSLRNRGIIDDRTQAALSRGRVLVAGCGSTGGAAVEPLVRLGVQHLTLADNGAFELNNLNRQHADYADLDRNKAEVAAGRASAVNPHADIAVEANGVGADNVERLVAGSDLVIDGVDVTDPAGWQAKFLVHRAAAALRRPVLSGYDMAGVQYVRCYDYRGTGASPFEGKISRSDVDTSTPWQLMMRVVPLRVVPLELIQDVRPNLGDPDYHLPQLVYTSQLFGAVASRMAAELLSGRTPRREVVIDVHDALRNRPERLRVAGRRWLELAKAGADIARLFRGTQPKNRSRTA